MQKDEYSPYKIIHHQKELECLKRKEQIVPKQVQLIISDLCNHNCMFCAYRMDGYTSSENFGEYDEEKGIILKNPNRKIPLEKVKEIQPDFLGFSSLLTITFDPMKEVIDKLKEEGFRDKLKIMVGGGITTSLVKDYIGADFQTIDAMEGVEYCLEIIKARVTIKARGGI